MIHLIIEACSKHFFVILFTFVGILERKVIDMGLKGDKMGRSIAIVSGKGGVGKTTLTMGLGMALAKKGASVCLIDLDIGLNNLDILMNVENKIIYDLSDCAEGKCRLKEALVRDPILQNLYILPSQKSQKEDCDYLAIKKIIERLSGVFDFVLIDAPAGVNQNFNVAINSAHEAIVVVSPHISSIRDADKVIGILKGLNMQNIFALVNRIRGDMVERKEMLSHAQIKDLLKVPLLGVLPESDDINIYSSFHFEKLAKGEIHEALSILANNLRSDKKYVYDYTAKYRGFFGMIRRNLKRNL